MPRHPAENALALDPAAPPRDRDEQLVRFVGRHGLAAMRHVMAVLGVGRTAAYRRVGACIEGGLLERVDLLRTEPGLLRATRDGLRYAGLGLPLAMSFTGAVDHRLCCVSTADGRPSSRRTDVADCRRRGVGSIVESELGGPRAMADDSKSTITTTTTDEDIARIVKAGEPGVATAMKVLEITEQHYYEAVHKTTPPTVGTRAASHT